MAVRPKRYNNGKRNVRAVKVTERNYIELLKWIFRNSTNVLPANTYTVEKVSASGDVSDQRIRLHIKGVGIRVARVGDYVVHPLEDDLSLTDASVSVIKGDAFEDEYTELKKV